MKKLFTIRRDILGIVLAFALVIGVVGASPLPVAADSGDNLVQLSSSQYTNFLDWYNVKTVTLYATTTTDYTENIPFSTVADAENVEWGWTIDGTTIDSTGSTSDGQLEIVTHGSIAYDDPSLGVEPFADPDPAAGYYAYVTVTMSEEADGTPRPYSIVGLYDDSYPINFTVVVEDPFARTNPNQYISAYVVNVTGGTPSFIDGNSSGPEIFDYVQSPVTLGEDSLFLDEPGALQKDPSVMSILDNQNAGGSITLVLTGDGGYVQSINGLANGWTYAVYDGNGDIVPISQVISASAFPLTDETVDYTAVFKYGGGYGSFQPTLAAEVASWTSNS
jgi:hypothetical protein